MRPVPSAAAAAPSPALALAAALALCACSGGTSPARPNYAGPAVAPSAGPASAPASLTFRFQVGDEVAVSVWKEPDLTVQQRVLSDGTISPPLLRSHRVVGLTVDEVRDRLTQGYLEFLRDPRVSVRVAAIHSDRVFVLGEVRTPQAVPMTGPTTLLEAVTLAGGFLEEFADKTEIRLVRRGADGRPDVSVHDARRMLAGHERDVALARGDIVYVGARGVTQWARTVGQALAPLSSALGTAGSVATISNATN